MKRLPYVSDNAVLAAEWNYEKNGSLTPEMVLPYSHKKVWWKCEKGHSWRTAIYSRKSHGLCLLMQRHLCTANFQYAQSNISGFFSTQKR